MSEAHQASTKSTPTFRQQKVMRRVLLALAPAAFGGVFFFGWRVLSVCVWVVAWGALAEYALARRRGDPLTESCFVTGVLLALSLPPTIPFWMAAVGIVVGIVFGKELFGGFGRNVFNPAIVGRAFLFVCFPVEMTGRFVPVWRGGLGGLLHWGPLTTYSGLPAVSAATPMWARRDYGHVTSFAQLFFGDIGGVYEAQDGVSRVLAAGSSGEVSALLLLLGGGYLLWTKTANWRLVVSSLSGATIAAVLFGALGGAAVPPVHWTLCSGAMLYACFFMVTDPVSAPNDRLAQFVYGAFIGVMIVFFRWKAVFAGGVAFAILLGNTVGPSIEMLIKAYRARRGVTRPEEGQGTRVRDT